MASDLIYLYRGKQEKTDDGSILVRRAVKDYCEVRGCPPDLARSAETAKIVRGPFGKPYFDGVPIYFSVSHTDGLWACAFSESEVGLDVQFMRQKVYDGVRRRFYTENESDYVDRYGLEGFYDVWVRREAFGKMTGRGIISEMPDMAGTDGKSVGGPGVLLRRTAVYEGKSYNIRSFFAGEEYRGAICSLSDEQEVKVLP
ncbi:MAG: 4'-phosphopantetheinyl transferase family protein [Eubacterium sp.]